MIQLGYIAILLAVLVAGWTWYMIFRSKGAPSSGLGPLFFGVPTVVLLAIGGVVMATPSMIHATHHGGLMIAVGTFLPLLIILSLFFEVIGHHVDNMRAVVQEDIPNFSIRKRNWLEKLVNGIFQLLTAIFLLVPVPLGYLLVIVGTIINLRAR